QRLTPRELLLIRPSDGVDAAVHVDDFAGGGGEPVGEQCGASAGGGFAVLDVPAEGGGLGPHVGHAFEAGDALGGHGGEGAGGDEVDADALGAEVFGQVAGAGLQAGLGHAHPVVDGPGLGGVEVEADDGAAVLHQGQAGHREGLQRV